MMVATLRNETGMSFGTKITFLLPSPGDMFLFVCFVLSCFPFEAIIYFDLSSAFMTEDPNIQCASLAS